ncbi:MAG: cobalt-precorrin-5B (C(1))-methyltransferase CbiD [Pseudanabaenaceae cyanobacterium bins.39]|nr:cobalt-precorrin-5B (C(1))-methyltransferase CbiD [Pseudanabaenaceae cyanobacterium bins.39]
MKSGYTLPVFAIAAAKSALLKLLANSEKHADIGSEISPEMSVELDLLEVGIAQIPINQCAIISQGDLVVPKCALAIAISDPGDNLDLTAGTPLWAWVSLEDHQDTNLRSPDSQVIILERLRLEGGEGLGKTRDGLPAIYQLTQDLAKVNLLPLIPPNQTATVRFILPEGEALAKRTSNAAFGILDGLSLLGTSAISKPLSVADKLEEFRLDLQAKVAKAKAIAFYIGANGYQVAQKLGFTEHQLVQTANWVGAMLVEAAILGVDQITLIGYHGKLLKLAGGIFNTSSHLADARIDILVRASVHVGLPLAVIQDIERSPTAEAVHQLLVTHGYDRAVFTYIADQITERAIKYVQKYSDRRINIQTILCDRLGNLLI